MSQRSICTRCKFITNFRDLSNTATELGLTSPEIDPRTGLAVLDMWICHTCKVQRIQQWVKMIMASRNKNKPKKDKG